MRAEESDVVLVTSAMLSLSLSHFAICFIARLHSIVRPCPIVPFYFFISPLRLLIGAVSSRFSISFQCGICFLLPIDDEIMIHLNRVP